MKLCRETPGMHSFFSMDHRRKEGKNRNQPVKQLLFSSLFDKKTKIIDGAE